MVIDRFCITEGSRALGMHTAPVSCASMDASHQCKCVQQDLREDQK